VPRHRHHRDQRRLACACHHRHRHRYHRHHCATKRNITRKRKNNNSPNLLIVVVVAVVVVMVRVRIITKKHNATAVLLHKDRFQAERNTQLVTASVVALKAAISGRVGGRIVQQNAVTATQVKRNTTITNNSLSVRGVSGARCLRAAQHNKFTQKPVRRSPVFSLRCQCQPQ
jgi:hypothetical protein